MERRHDHPITIIPGLVGSKAASLGGELSTSNLTTADAQEDGSEDLSIVNGLILRAGSKGSRPS